MRDPAASLRFEGDWVLRDLRGDAESARFLETDLARRWVDEHRLVPFEHRGPRQLAAPRLPFVTQPSEWTDAQLLEAAKLTLTLQQEAVAQGFDLKDASAWNVLFDGARPVFCDLLSFEPLAQRPWWAMGQFARHFVLPLLVSKRTGFRAGAQHQVWRDGLPPAQARGILGWRGSLSRYGALMAGGPAAAHSSVDFAEAPARRHDLAVIQSFRRRLHATLDWQLDGLAIPRVDPGASSGWSGYESDRPHYEGDSLDRKRRQVAEWIERVDPTWTIDFGCNAGEFSAIALAHGGRVIGMDADHDSIQRLYLRHAGHPRLYAVVAPLDDLRGGRGWEASEHPGLTERLTGAADLVMMLALIHHLSIGASIPLAQVARFAWNCTRRAAIIELLDETDPQLMALCRQRRREPAEFSAARQRQALEKAGFVLWDECRLAPSGRTLLLLGKTAP
jgi:hypothetical protein